MSASTFARDTRQLGTGAPLNDAVTLPVKAGEKGYGGTIGTRDSSGRAVRAVVATGLVALGRVRADFDNTAVGAADGDVSATIERGIFKFAQGDAPTTISSVSNGKLDFTPNTSGVTVVVAVAGTNTALSVSVAAKAITINSATGGGGAATSTAAQILAAVQASAAAMALLTSVALTPSNDGTGITGAVGSTALRYERITQIDADCYILDDQTVVATDGGSARSAAGKVHQIDADGVYVRMGV